MEQVSVHVSLLKAISIPEPLWSSKSNVLEACISGTGLSCVPKGSTNSLFLREKLQLLSSLLAVGHHGSGEVYDKLASQPFLPTLMWFSSCLPDVKRLPAFRVVFFLRKSLHIEL